MENAMETGELGFKVEGFGFRIPGLTGRSMSGSGFRSVFQETQVRTMVLAIRNYGLSATWRAWGT